MGVNKAKEPIYSDFCNVKFWIGFHFTFFGKGGQLKSINNFVFICETIDVACIDEGFPFRCILAWAWGAL